MNKQLMLRHAGYTLVELVLVVLIMGVLVVVATPKWTAGSQGLQYEARRVLGDIRYAQAMSLASGERYRWVRTSSTAYQITDESGSALLLPNGSTTMVLANGITFGAFTNLPNNLIAFDSRGVPYTTSTYPGTALSATATIPLSSNGDTQNISITASTGYGVLP